ncbi:highly reducing polyketide synthase PKS6-like [Megalops cyprinoides]|uniref:highly reducing polyketide synthase PKS6-like n=1 Tax=Megalops cyprinoides TaxID=118141 RepID=UPI001864C18B|nr:highly reducing polyketide synthase PKS6-like [Megalops cyprinoides]
MEDSEAFKDIAVVGIGCHFPGGEGLDSFWKVLMQGRNCVVQIPEDRFDSTVWYDLDDSKAGKTRTAKAALIEGFNQFDHRFFGIAEAEVDFMDPQQKLLLECTYRALEDAGIPMEKASGTRTGVFIGLMNRDYETLLNNSPSTISHYNGTGTAMSIAANRISYTFNFTGPSLAIDSACSSSLVALHYAIQAIKQGDCEMAVCGGVSCIIEPRVFVALSKAKMISPEGTSKPFSSRADGYGRGEGCGIVLLKPLKKALQDFDHIWGIISRTAVNQDGRSVTPITKPSMAQQEELLRRVYSMGIDPSHVQYIEAHGTGTPVGDPTEAGSISRAIAKARPGSDPLCIGSVKGNIGHTESAAGVAGLIKVLLMMHHETLVPSLFYSEDGASIDGKALNLKIPTRVEKWEKTGPMGRAAGVNNFGFGGTNAHVIVREYMKREDSRSVFQRSPKLFVLSAASEKSIAMAIADISEELSRDKTVDLQTLTYTSACRRSHARHKYRRVFVTSSISDLQEQLKCSLTKNIAQSKSDTRLVFVFCGNGVTYRGMCKQLLKEEPVFREKVKEVENLFQKYKSTSILQKLEDDYDNEDYSKPDVVQPLLFAIQVAIVSLLKHWGVRPDAILGHSVGEVAAAHCSGLLSLEDAVKVIYFRSVLQSRVTGGKMLVVSNVEVSEIMKLLPAYSGKVCLAAFNSPQSCTLSGDADVVESLHQKLKTSFKSKNLFLHILGVPAAYHSHMMDPILTQIEDNIGCLQENEIEVQLFSTVTGKVFSQGDFSTGKYWARNVREPVAFEQAVKTAAKDMKNVVFVEIGPRRALQRNIMETLGNDVTVFTSVQPDKDRETLLTVVSQLFELGVQVNWDQFYKGCEAPPTPFPRYHFDCVKKEVFFEAVRRGNEMTCHSHYPLIRQTKRDSQEFSCNLSSAASYIREHKNNGVALVPGTLHVELALASFVSSTKSKTPLSSLQLSITFHSPCILTKNSPEIEIHLEPFENSAKFRINSPSVTYASGTIDCKRGTVAPEEQNICLDTVFRRCESVIKTEQVYTILSQAGFQYGSVFRQLGDVYYGEDLKEAVSTVKVPDEIVSQLHDYCLHPVVLDYILQMAAVVAVNGFTSRAGFPSAIGCMTVSRPLLEEMVMYLRATSETSEGFEVCGCFTDKDGHVLVELKQVKITLLGESSCVAKEFFFHNELHATSEDANLSYKPKALVFSDHVGVANSLQQYLHAGSTFIWCKDPGKQSSLQFSDFISEFKVADTDKDYEEVLFIWGLQNLNPLNTDSVLESLVSCCDIFRQVVLALKAYKYTNTIRVLTYRSSERTVDHISPGFVLSGMTRACAAEIPGFLFQLIDLASVTSEDIRLLAHVISSYPSSTYPELMISNGQIYSTAIARTPVKSVEGAERRVCSSEFDRFILQTADPYRMTGLSAILSSDSGDQIQKQTVEVRLSKICVHSSDYYPVSVSDLTFGQTMYWNEHTSQNHKLLALDFSGIVTAVGRGVSKLKVGDRVVSCYPVAASSKIVIPEAACYSTKKLPFLKEVPCVSYFVLSWEILHRTLPKVRQQGKLGIITPEPDSSLVQVLMLTANQSGWNAIVGSQSSGLLQNVNKCDAFVLLPPFDASLVAKACNVSTARNIVVVCSNQVSPSLSQNILKSENENACIQTLQVASVFQKAYLARHKRWIYRWLKSMRLTGMPTVLRSTTFERAASGSIDTLPIEDPTSYFSSKTTSVVVLRANIKDTISLPFLGRSKQLFQRDSVYIVTGGLSGLGFETVKFIAQKGGGNIVILSRSAPSPDMQVEIDNVRNQCGVSIINLQCDVSLSAQVVKAVTLIGQRFPFCPIRGVFHSAVVLHDGLLETLDRCRFEKVFRPKVNGALNLHHATRHCKLDYFVCYSSISSFIGNASQANYAAANSFLDMFCHYRRSLGLAGQSINWGALNLGLLLNKDHLQKFLEAKGMMVMEVPEFHKCLEHCLLQNNPQQVVCKFSFRNLRKHVLSQNTSLKMRLSTLVDRELKNSKVTETRAQPSGFSPCTLPGEYVRTVIGETCHVDCYELRDEATLSSLGIDSMVAMTLQNLIFQDSGVSVPLITLLDPNSTLSTLVSIMKEGKGWRFQQDDQKSALSPLENKKDEYTEF